MKSGEGSDVTVFVSRLRRSSSLIAENTDVIRLKALSRCGLRSAAFRCDCSAAASLVSVGVSGAPFFTLVRLVGVLVGLPPIAGFPLGAIEFTIRRGPDFACFQLKFFNLVDVVVCLRPIEGNQPLYDGVPEHCGFGNDVDARAAAKERSPNGSRLRLLPRR
jgi:hypothetical protein